MSGQTSLSDNHRRTMCRIVFLILCAVPTSFAIYFIFHQPGPEEWSGRIWAQLGIRVKITSVETPVPYQTILRGVIVTRAALGEDSRAEEELLIDEIRITADVQKNIVTIAQPFELNTDALSKVLKRCTSQLEQAEFGNKIWRFEFGKISLTDKQSVVPDFVMEPALLDVGCIDSQDQSGIKSFCATLLATLPDFESRQRSEDPGSMLRVKYRKQADGNSIAIDTGSGAIPCHLFRHWQNEVNRLGTRSVFNGTIDLYVTNLGRASADVLGRLANVELDRISDPFNVGVHGSCNVSNLDCKIRNNKIEFAQFRVDASHSVRVSGQVLAAAAGLGIKTGPVKRESNYIFPRVQIAASIYEGFIRLSGGENSTIAWDREGNPTAKCDDAADIPVQLLAEFMTGESTFGSQSFEFLNWFKLKEPEHTAENPVDQTPRY